MIVWTILAKMDSALILRMTIDVSVNLAMAEKNAIFIVQLTIHHIML